ncbi:MAG: diguanylate cyclase [Deltaproteobacteria bacterium]|nr:diguanylate cyclase [Deltaproteobacteria bacterium]
MKGKLRILIIDDDPMARRTLSDILHVYGYEALAAKDGAEAFAELQRGPVNLALIDLQLPDIPGTDVMAGIKDRSPSTEVIIMTGHATLESAIEATNRGAFSYLIKPYDVQQLLLHIQHALEKQRVAEELRKSEERLDEAQKVAHLGNWEWDISDNEFWWSDEMYRILGLAPQEKALTFEVIFSITHHDDREIFRDAVNGLFSEHTPYNMNFRVTHPAVGKRIFHAEGKTKTGWDGKPLSLIGVIQDITENMLAEDALRESNERFRIAFENAAIGMAVTALDGHWLKVNHSLCTIFGYSEQELLANTVQDITHSDDLSIDIRGYKRLLDGETSYYRSEKRCLHKKSHFVWVRQSVSLVRDAQGRPLYFVSQIEDVTDRKSGEEALNYRVEIEQLISSLSTRFLRLESNRLDEGIDGALKDIGEFTGVDRTYVFLWSDGGATMRSTNEWRADGIEPLMENLQRFTVDSFPGLIRSLSLIETIHIPRAASLSDDAKEMREFLLPRGVKSAIIVPLVFGASLIGFFGFESIRQEETWSEADIRLITMIGEIFSGSFGRRYTEKEREDLLYKTENANKELNAANSKLSALYNIALFVNRTTNLDEITSSSLELIIYGMEILNIEKRGAIFLVEGDRLRLAAQFNLPAEFIDFHEDEGIGKCSCGMAVKSGKIMVLHSDDSECAMVSGPTPCGCIIVPLKSAEGVVGVLCLYMSAQEEAGEATLKMLSSIGSQLGIAIDNARLYEITKALSLHDPLTGLANRRLMYIELEKGLARAQRYGSLFSVIMADIDNFKQYNDSFGHTAGDKLLVEMAKALAKEARQTDLVARYGGEEFLVLLPETGIEDACKVAERIRVSVASQNETTISLGVAPYRAGTTMEALISHADSAMYKAKQEGRNRVEKYAYMKPRET